MRQRTKWLTGLTVAFALSLSVATAAATAAFAAPVSEDTMHGDFSVQWGEWVQYRSDSNPGDENLVALGVKAGAPSEYAIVADKAFITSERLNTTADFSVSFETAIPSADADGVGSVGFFARASVDSGSGGKVINNMGGFLVEIFRSSMRIVYNNPSLTVASGTAFSESVTAGQIVKVEISVASDVISAELKKDDGTSLSTATATSGVQYAAELKAGFSMEKTKALESGEYMGSYAVFRNVVYTAGEKQYKAYPFESSAAPDTPDPVDPTEELNPNFAVTTGAYKGTEDGNYVKTVSRHPQYDNSVMVSTFGGVYGESFSISFKLRTPTAVETTAYPDASSGFFFRQAISWNLYSGIYVRVEKDKVVIVNNLSDPDAINSETATTTEGAFKSAVAPESTISLTVTVEGDDITVTAKDAAGENILGVESLTTKARKDYEENLVAGLASDHMDGVFSEIVMTSGNKEFKAYPLDPSKQSSVEGVEIGGTGLKKVMLTKGNPDVREDDEDIIDGEFEFILYAEYDGTAKDLTATGVAGAPLPQGYTAHFEYRLPPTWEFFPWEEQTDACRHGCAMYISDEDGYVYVRKSFAFKIYAKTVTITGIAAENKPYDGSTEVTLTGGTLNGVLPADADKVSFTLGIGIADQASVGSGINVSLPNVALTGDKAANYELTPPESVTVDITKGKAETPDSVFIEDKSDTSITVEEIYGAEYSIDGTTWQDENVFENLKPGTEYTVSVRIKANENQDASDPATVTVKTDGAASSGSGCGGAISAAACGTIAAVAALATVVVFVRKRKE